MNFTQQFNIAAQGLDRTELALGLKVSITTIDRWFKGISAPHPIGQEAVFKYLNVPIV